MIKIAILVNKNTRVIVQGITGHQGAFHMRLMLDYGTKIVAGVTPSKGGTTVRGIPVYDTIREALDEIEATASICFVPSRFAKNAIMEAIDANLSPIVVVTEWLPVHDTMLLMKHAKDKGITIVGPNTPGIISVGECKLGIMPTNVFKQGKVGVLSRSGTLTYEIASSITRKGYGQTTCIGIGGDPIIGLDFVETLQLFNKDDETELITIIGEIGGNLEEKAAAYIKSNIKKPIVAYIAGRTVPLDKRMGHAGAIITGKTGTAESKIKAFEAVDVPVAKRPTEVAELIEHTLQ